MLLDFNDLIKKFNMNITGVIHIGAHYGQEHELYVSQGIKNIVYFEPLKKTFDILKSRVGNDSVLFNYALGNENKKIEMFVESANNGMSSSILEPKLHTEQYPHIVFDNKEIVDMRRLDEIEFNFNGYNFINIDVQGYELEVFKGSENTLKNIDYIISEINRDELYKNCSKVNDLIEFLEPYGFQLVEQNWEGNTWGDGLFIKHK